MLCSAQVVNVLAMILKPTGLQLSSERKDSVYSRAFSKQNFESSSAHLNTTQVGWQFNEHLSCDRINLFSICFSDG